MKLKIPVSKWLHGTEDVDKLFDGSRLGSMLHRPQDDKRCCIGLYLEACGVPLKAITDVGDPSDVKMESEQIPDEAKWLIETVSDPNDQGYKDEIINSRDAEELIRENDGDAREDKIAEIFSRHNVEVEFIHD